jgi:hypothetical protein
MRLAALIVPPGRIELDLVEPLQSHSRLLDQESETFAESPAMLGPETSINFIAHFIAPSHHRPEYHRNGR